MAKEIDFNKLLKKYKSDPFTYVDMYAPHTGVLTLLVSEGQEVFSAAGQWKQIPGSQLYQIERERNKKKIESPINGIVQNLSLDLDGRFVEAGKKILTIKCPLSKDEIIELILKKVLTLFYAPETAKYYFSPEFRSALEKQGLGVVAVDSGDQLFTMSLMKRDTPLNYLGESGVIYSVYFENGMSISQGEPLIGVCLLEQIPLIKKIVATVKSDWVEQ